MGWRQRFEDRPLIMGVLNITPDSFYDGGRYYAPDAAVEHALRLAEEGADIIDVGGESTRPSAEATSVEEELGRVIPVIKGIRTRSNVFISIDTYKARVAQEAVDAGADMINDISGLSFDNKIGEVAAESKVPVVIMHIKGTPKEMQVNPQYDDVIG
jgi:dihydropteroate synthase